MIRINLLPPEVLEKRKTEHLWSYVVFGALALSVLLVAFWGTMFIQIQMKQGQLEALRQEEMTKNLEAARNKIFEDKKQDLQQRQTVAQTALAGRVNWSKLLTEVSLVLPSDVWVKQVQGSEANPLLIDGFALINDEDSPEGGHKSIAKMLVRVADLQQLKDVWLKSSTKTEYLDGQQAIAFSLSATVDRPGAPQTTTAPGVPAPPSSNAK